jgi:hypothetical protein
MNLDSNMNDVLDVWLRKNEADKYYSMIYIV